MSPDDRALRPTLGWRVVFAVVAVVFVAAALSNFGRILSGTMQWNTTNIIGVPVIVLLALLCALAAVSAQRHRVWVDQAENRIYMRILGKTSSRSLDPPTTVRFSYKPPKRGDLHSRGWIVMVSSVGERPLNIRAPWIPSIEELAWLLQPALTINPDLPADDLSRRVLEDPSHIVQLQNDMAGKNRQP